MSRLPVLPALVAALLFGASTPLAKRLGADVSPLLLAGLLYLGSGIGLAIALAVRRVAGGSGRERALQLRIPRSDLPWLCGAVIAGGIVGPVLLMTGLRSTDGASAALLLNVEGVLTATIAWLVFRENADRRIVAGMVAIVAGGMLLAWHPESGRLSPGALLVVGACLAWAIDNNLTRRVSANDAMLLACIKGLAAGACNTSLAFATGATLPQAGVLVATLLVGLGGYGLSLVLFVVALRGLGAARTGAYFSVAPLFGVAVAFVLWPQAPARTFWAAAALMGIGVWLHLRERHDHRHAHQAVEHEHVHVHDAHHRHAHAFPVGDEPHRHRHMHAPMVHRHPHYPDIHHRHSH